MTALSVSASGPAADAIATAVPQLVEAQFASKLFAKDPTLWGEAAESESSKRLSWVGLARSSRPLVGEIAALRDDLVGKGLDHVVLCGMGGSSLAPEVICATEGKELVVLDSSDPDYVRAALQDKLDRTVVVVSSKSGSTVETDSQKRAYEGAFTDAGIDPTERIVIVTDPGSPLDKSAREAGYRVVNADPDVGGRYSALTAFGLVPSGLAGVDIEALLDDAESVADLLAADDDANPALRLGAAIGGTNPLRNKLAIVDDGSGIVGFADWAEQLIAESTGKCGHRHPAGRRGRRRRPRGQVAGPRRHGGPAGQRRRRRRAGVGRHRRRRGRPHAFRGRGQRLARRADAAVGGRDGRGRPAARHQPVRPARRRERQGRGPRAARQGPRRGRGPGRHRRRDRDPHDGRRRRLARRRHDGGRRAGRAVRPARPEPGLRRGDGLPRPAVRRAARGLPRGPSRCARSVRRRSAGGRGSCTRPASSTRAAPRSASTCRSRRRRRRTSPSPAGSSPSATSSRPRPAATRRCSRTTGGPCSSCT